MRNGAKRRRSIAPKRRKTANDGMGSVVAEHRENNNGTCCGPYYYWYRYEAGKRTKTYLPREEGEKKQAELARMRRAGRLLRDLLGKLQRDADRAADTEAPSSSQGSPTGRYWHGRELRISRGVPNEMRDRALFKCNMEMIRKDLGFAITEDDYVQLMKMVRSELAKRSQQGNTWS